MHPINFHSEEFILKGKEPHIDNMPVLPVHYGSSFGLISCWQLSFLERLRLLFFGRLFLVALGIKHPPVYLTTYPNEVGLDS
jgi:hypothetical protein